MAIWRYKFYLLACWKVLSLVGLAHSSSSLPYCSLFAPTNQPVTIHTANYINKCFSKSKVTS